MAALAPSQSAFATVGLSAVDAYRFTGDGSNFWIANRGNADLWVRVDGVDPVANTDGSHLIPGMTIRTFADPTGNKDVRLTAGAGTCMYAVELL